jgi:hypothetical protein
VVGEALERRQRGQAPELINISWRAQRRLNARWRQLKDARRKPNGIVAVAIARELTGYCWEIATWMPHPDPAPPASLPAGDTLTHAASIPPKLLSQRGQDRDCGGLNHRSRARDSLTYLRLLHGSQVRRWQPEHVRRDGVVGPSDASAHP